MLTATRRRWIRRPAAFAAAVVVASAGVVAGTATPAGAAPCPANFICIGDRVFVPRSGGGGGGGGGGCTWDGQAIPCTHPEYGWYVGACDTTVLSDLRPELREIGRLFVMLPAPGWYDGPPPAGAAGSGGWYVETCAVYTDEGPQSDAPAYYGRSAVWFATSADAVAILEDLAAEALAAIGPRGAQIGLAPDPDGAGLVGLPVWMWTGVSATTWGPATATATDGPISVQVTARVQSIDWDMGDGTVVTCTTPGTPYSVEYGNTSSPDCGHRYLAPSRDEPDGMYQVTATSHWVAEWEITTGGLTGTIEADRTSDVTVRINEMQVLIS
jgi:hypothetical protein